LYIITAYRPTPEQWQDGGKKTKGEKPMKCGICKAEMEERTVTYTEDIEQSVIVIRHVPAYVCTECGNKWFSGTVASQLEKLVEKSASSSTEVSIVNYSKSVA
jgi:YgiT-type zinc finger domain-containing protein